MAQARENQYALTAVFECVNVRTALAKPKMPDRMGVGWCLIWRMTSMKTEEAAPATIEGSEAARIRTCRNHMCSSLLTSTLTSLWSLTAVKTNSTRRQAGSVAFDSIHPMVWPLSFSARGGRSR
jgi:hypothetical protein